jgi:hypothetical protein
MIYDLRLGRCWPDYQNGPPHTLLMQVQLPPPVPGPGFVDFGGDPHRFYGIFS